MARLLHMFSFAALLAQAVAQPTDQQVISGVGDTTNATLNATTTAPANPTPEV